MFDRQCELGLIGLGTMGRNFLLNVGDHGFSAVGYDLNESQRKTLTEMTGQRHLRTANTIEEFIASLSVPRAIMLLVPASGGIVDSVLNELMPHLAGGDVIIDAGNSYFKDTDRRAQALAEKNIHFLGIGVSGGEVGARSGPSIMPGGPKDAYERVEPILQAVAAKVGGEPCVAWLGKGSAGHYVKMVHNGIEYGLMQLIAECYDVMKRSLRLSNDQLHDVFASWNTGRLESFLLGITAEIFLKDDELTGKRLIDLVLDEAGHKGTGMWTSESSLELHMPTPTIDLAVVMRDMSAYKNMLREWKNIPAGPQPGYDGDPAAMIAQLRGALEASASMTYAQGMATLAAASLEFGYDLNLSTVAKIWRGGCIIRSAMLDDIRQAYSDAPGLANLLLDERFSRPIEQAEDDLRAVVSLCAQRGIPAPGMMASLAYLDSCRSTWLPANLIQAQRDYFGHHTYHRSDRPGVFHTDWGNSK
jgi:6-phosphogluconate dehydrogenase